MLEDMSDNPDDAGEISMSFHYGSRHDGVGLDCPLPGPKSVKAYICDDCYEQKKHLCVVK